MLTSGVGAEAQSDLRFQRILQFERQWPRHERTKEEAIRKEFGVSTPRYYQMLASIIETRDALAYDPILVKRLLSLREARFRAREARFASL